MSVQHTVWALKDSPVKSAAERLMLIQLSEHVNCDETHTGTMPPLDFLAARCVLTSDRVVSVLGALVTRGIVTVDDPAGTFSLNMGAGR